MMRGRGGRFSATPALITPCALITQACACPLGPDTPTFLCPPCLFFKVLWVWDLYQTPIGSPTYCRNVMWTRSISQAVKAFCPSFSLSFNHFCPN